MRTGEQCMTEDIMEIDIGRIRPYEKNPRNNGKSVDKVAGSIREFGFLQPIVCDGDGVILAGHTRYKALLALGREDAQCLICTGLTGEQKKKYRFLDNKTGEKAAWDLMKLETELEGLDLEGFDFFGSDIGDGSTQKKEWDADGGRFGVYPAGLRLRA